MEDNFGFPVGARVMVHSRTWIFEAIVVGHKINSFTEKPMVVVNNGGTAADNMQYYLEEVKLIK